MVRARGTPFVTALVVLALGFCVACSGSPRGGHSAEPLPPSGPTCAAEVLASLTQAQIVGQLFMIGVPLTSPDAAALAAVTAQSVGGVILYGHSRAPLTSIRTLTDQVRAAGAAAVPDVAMYIATDQEGGQIQDLSGPGFTAMPSAVDQGMMDPVQLRSEAQQWGAQLVQAGVNVDLAPVLDVVPAAFEVINQPIAHYDRQFGATASTVATHGAAVVRGLQAAGVSATLKHFPGLGRVVGDTDTTANVVDTLTARHDPLLTAFAGGIQAGATFVMISLAIYQQIDPGRQAAFSSIVIRDMLRHDLDFHGLVISDDLGSAQAVQAIAPGVRATSFLGAGGDLVLVNRPATVVAPMVAAVLAEATADPAFRAVVRSDALAVLTAKQAAGLLVCP